MTFEDVTSGIVAIGDHSDWRRALRLTCWILVVPASMICPGREADAQVSGGIEWWAITSELADRDEEISLSSDPLTLNLRNGWSCEVRIVLSNQARELRCTKGSETVSASAQCDANRPRDHVQLRFSSESVTGPVDETEFIEVGCRIAGRP